MACWMVCAGDAEILEKIILSQARIILNEKKNTLLPVYNSFGYIFGFSCQINSKQNQVPNSTAHPYSHLFSVANLWKKHLGRTRTLKSEDIFPKASWLENCLTRIQKQNEENKCPQDFLSFQHRATVGSCAGEGKDPPYCEKTGSAWLFHIYREFCNWMARMGVTLFIFTNWKICNNIKITIVLCLAIMCYMYIYVYEWIINS